MEVVICPSGIQQTNLGIHRAVALHHRDHSLMSGLNHPVWVNPEPSRISWFWDTGGILSSLCFVLPKMAFPGNHRQGTPCHFGLVWNFVHTSGRPLLHFLVGAVYLPHKIASGAQYLAFNSIWWGSRKFQEGQKKTAIFILFALSCVSFYSKNICWVLPMHKWLAYRKYSTNISCYIMYDGILTGR